MKVWLVLLLCAASAAGADGWRWWEGFGDPKLEEIVRAAAEKSFAVRLAQARIEESKAGVRSARAARLPGIDYRGQNAWVRGLIPSFGGGAPGAFIGPRETAVVQKSLEARFDTDIWGAKRLAEQAAVAESNAAVERAAGAAVEAARTAGQLYVDLRATQQRCALAREEIRLLHDLLDVAENRRKAGLGNQGAVAATQAELARAEARLRQLESEASKQLIDLAEATGSRPGQWSDLARQETGIPAQQLEPPVDLPASLLDRRPDVRESRMNLAAAMALRKEAKRARLPQIQIVGSLGRLADSFPGLLLGNSSIFTIGNSVLFPLFDGGRLKANFEIRSAQERQASIRLEESVARALAELESARNDWATARERRQALEKARLAAAEEAEIAERAYEAGIGDWSEVLERKRKVMVQREELVLNRAAESRAQIGVFAALGGAW